MIFDMSFPARVNTWQYSKQLLGVCETHFKFQVFLTDLIPKFNTSKILEKPAVKITVSFRLNSAFPPNWK